MSFLKNLKFKMDGQLKEAKISSIFSLIYRIGILMLFCINVFPYNFPPLLFLKFDFGGIINFDAYRLCTSYHSQEVFNLQQHYSDCYK